VSDQVGDVFEHSNGLEERRRPPPPGKTFLADAPQPYTREWVMRLPLREQGTLMAGIRGCDAVSDFFWYVVDQDGRPTGQVQTTRHPTKYIVAALRYAVGTPHDPREVDTPGAFMASQLPDVETWPVKCLDDLPLHFVMHLLHAIEVIAYRGPHEVFGGWLTLYYRICNHMHVIPEDRARMIERLSEDRIALGTVKALRG
jgi:hypothetical protein